MNNATLTPTALVVNKLSNRTGDPSVSVDTSIESLGLDSLDYMLTILEVQEALGDPEIDLDRLSSVETVADLIATFETTNGTPQ